MIISQNCHALENSISKYKDVKPDMSQRKKNNFSSKPVFNHSNKSKDQEKRFDSMKKIIIER